MTLQLGMIAVVIVAIAIAANGAMALADLAGARFVLANSAEVGVPRTWVPMLGLLKGAGAVGLLVGLVAFPPLGVAAAIGPRSSSAPSSPTSARACSTTSPFPPPFSWSRFWRWVRSWRADPQWRRTKLQRPHPRGVEPLQFGV